MDAIPIVTSHNDRPIDRNSNYINRATDLRFLNWIRERKEANNARFISVILSIGFLIIFIIYVLAINLLLVYYYNSKLKNNIIGASINSFNFFEISKRLQDDRNSRLNRIRNIYMLLCLFIIFIIYLVIYLQFHNRAFI